MHNVYKGIREWRKTDWVLFGLGCAFLTASVVIMLVGQIG